MSTEQTAAATPNVFDLIDELEALADTVESPRDRERIQETISVAREMEFPTVFGRVIQGFDRSDAAEALVGSVVFGIPIIVEGGTLEVGEFIAAHPLFHLGTLAFGVAMVIGLLYVADIQQVEITRPIFGVLPRRLAGVLAISFTTSFILMTVWGRVDWSEPQVAFAQVSFVFVGMALGAALGDILPGS